MGWDAQFTAWNNLVDHSHPGGMTSGSPIHKQAALVCHFTNLIESDGAYCYFNGVSEVGSIELREALWAVGAPMLASQLEQFVEALGMEIPPHTSDGEREDFVDKHQLESIQFRGLEDPAALNEAEGALKSHVSNNLSFYLSLSTPEELAYDKFIFLAQDPFTRVGLVQFKSAAIAARMLACFRLWGVRRFFEEAPQVDPEEALSAIEAIGASRTARSLRNQWLAVDPPLVDQISQSRAPGPREIRRDELDLPRLEYQACYQELEHCLRKHAGEYKDFYLASA